MAGVGMADEVQYPGSPTVCTQPILRRATHETDGWRGQIELRGSGCWRKITAMHRRSFIAVVALGLAAAPLIADAQTRAKTWRARVLSRGAPAPRRAATRRAPPGR